MSARIRVSIADAGVPKTGLSPTISIWDATTEDGGSTLISAASMTEMACPGDYSYVFTGYDPDNEYVWQIDGGATLENIDRYHTGSTAIPTPQKIWSYEE